MKTRATFLKLFAGAIMVTIINLTSLSQEQVVSEHNMSEPMYFSYMYNSPITFDEPVTLQRWMSCDLAYGNFRDVCYFIEEWMMDNMAEELLMIRDMMELSEWMLPDDERLDFEIAFMEWMFDFEPDVVDELLHGNELPDVEKWMFDSEQIAELSPWEVSIDLIPWMWCIEFGFVDPYSDVENWMFSAFSMN